MSQDSEKQQLQASYVCLTIGKCETVIWEIALLSCNAHAFLQLLQHNYCVVSVVQLNQDDGK